MGDVTRILEQIEGGDGIASERLFPLVYRELRRLAAAQMQCRASRAKRFRQPHLSMKRTYGSSMSSWPELEKSRPLLCRRGRGDAADPDRTSPRQASRETRRGLEASGLREPRPGVLGHSGSTRGPDDALVRLTELDGIAGQLVSLRYFAGMSLADAAGVTGVSTATAYRHWAYARAWLSCELMKNA